MATSSSGTVGPGASEVRDQLARILNHTLFSKSKMRSRLLATVVNRSLDGTGSEIKEYLLGVEALGRSPSFDPRFDSVVRVNATHVRRKLAEYYTGAGATDPVRIELPRGAYTPVFAWNSPVPEIGSPPEASIAVLPCTPFESNVPDQSFCDGVTEELIDVLARQPGIRVVARTSAWAFKGKTGDVREAGAILGVRIILESSLRRDGPRLRIAARLSDASTGFALWSRNFDAESDDTLAVQERIAHAIAGEIGPKLARPRTKPDRPRLNGAAYEEWSLAKFRFNKHTNDDFRKAVSAFEKTIAMAPDFAPAYSGLGEVLVHLGLWGGMPPASVMKRAERLARRALELDPADAPAHQVIGMIQALFYWNWKASETSFQESLRIAPGSAAVKSAYAMICLLPLCRLEEAASTMGEAVRLEPLSLPILANCANVWYSARQFGKAEERCRYALDLDSRFVRGWSNLARILIVTGRPAEAIGALKRGLSSAPEGTFHKALEATMAIALVHADRREEARAYLPRTDNLSPDALYWRGLALAWMGETEAAFATLDLASVERDPWLPRLACEPLADILKSDRRYEALVRRINLANNPLRIVPESRFL